MTYLEIRIHELMALQPDTSPDEDQILVDRVIGTHNDLAPLVEHLVRLEELPPEGGMPAEGP